MPLDVDDLIANCYPVLHATGESDAVFVDTAELTSLFKEALKRLAENYGLFVERDTTTITLADGVATYSLPARHLSAIHVAVSNRPLAASARHELERLDANYTTTEETASGTRPGLVKRFYEDKQGFNLIGFHPVPKTGFSAGSKPEVIFHRYPCDLSDGIETPRVLGDYLEIQVIGEAYRKESDLRMPEVAESSKQLAALYENVIQNLWGSSQ